VDPAGVAGVAVRVRRVVIASAVRKQRRKAGVRGRDSRGARDGAFAGDEAERAR